MSDADRDAMRELGAAALYEAERELVGNGEPTFALANSLVRAEYLKSAEIVLAAALVGEQAQ